MPVAGAGEAREQCGGRLEESPLHSARRAPRSAGDERGAAEAKGGEGSGRLDGGNGTEPGGSGASGAGGQGPIRVSTAPEKMCSSTRYKVSKFDLIKGGI